MTLATPAIGALPTANSTETPSPKNPNAAVTTPNSQTETVKKTGTVFTERERSIWNWGGLVTSFVAARMICDNLAPLYLTLPLVIGGILTSSFGAIGAKPLQVASLYSLTNTSKLLLRLGGDPEAKDLRGYSAWDYAVATNNYPLMEHLLALGATHDSDNIPSRIRTFIALVKKLSDSSSAASQNLRQLIPIAKSSNRISQAMQKVTSLWQRWFGSRYTPPDGPFEVSEKESPLHYAAASGDLAEIERLAKSGINIRDRYGFTPLYSAIIFNKLDAVEKLVTLGADINAEQSDGRTPLAYAICSNKYSNAAKLITLGADINAKDPDGWTLLHLAILCDDLDTAEKLFALGADINARDSFGWTPLYSAVATDKHDRAEKLIALGADVDTPVRNELSALARMQINQSFANTTVLEAALQASNGGTQEIDDRKLLANYFALSGISDISGGSFNLGGLRRNQQNSAINVPALSFYSPIIKGLEAGDNRLWSGILQNLSPENRQKFDFLDKADIIRILKNSLESIAESTTTSIDDALERHAKSLPVAIVTGYPGHAISLILWKDKIAICDKSSGTPGVLFYTIKKPEALREVLEKCIKAEETTETYFTKDIISELGLDYKVYGRQKPQKGPNCVVANTKVDLLTHFVQFAALVDVDAAWDLANTLKRCRSLATRVENLQSYLSKHDKLLPFSPDLGLIGQIYYKKTGKPDEDKRIQAMIEEWAAKKNINLKAVHTLSVVQAFLDLDLDSKMPDLSLISRAYELKTGDENIDRQLRSLIDLWVKEKNLQWQT